MSHSIAHKSAVAGTHDTELLDIQMLQKLVYAFCLEKFSSGLVGGEGSSCEQEVGNENVKGAGEAGHLSAPSVRVESESMKEH